MDDGGDPDEEGWTMVIPKWRRKRDKRKWGDSYRKDRSYKDVVASPKPKWEAKADLVQNWRRTGKAKERDQQVSVGFLDYLRIDKFKFQLVINFINDWVLPNCAVFDDLSDLNP